ncbi:nuclear mRNA splicing protein [Cryptococcus bacillisporus CA1873]|uniref:Nuclear mRNA splicing protein n=1 Tax=Cryptococcus bacillisporus CA1873 TaxID=1296111 RepID=A0ABR5BD57_CRYGA|nr:nuclear mRNA splicing protein [Cryptococcus bacillisporus CA1873]|eukprot:KIR67115.1 nuclear mRNA splicing protein [Cryptococcus gattii CA1873]
MNRAVQRSQLFNPAGQQTRSQYDPQNPGMQHRGPAGSGPQQQYQQYQQYQQPQQQGQQQQQQQQQLSQQGPQSTNGTADGASGTGSTPGQEMNLASVLHYLQSEWRRWERDRNEWEIERAEMRARIALLEGQRRSAENLKVDLLRRVKMLEFALRQERTKSVGAGGKLNSVPPTRLAVLQDEDRLSTGDKEGSGSEGSQDDIVERPTNVNGVHSAAIGKSSTIVSRSQPAGVNQWKNIGVAPRDPKARARSREYLKQCLQEISYLTSPGALNPLPPYPPIDPSALPQPEVLHDPNHPEVDPYERPRKELPEEPVQPLQAQKRNNEAAEIKEAAGSTSISVNDPVNGEKDKHIPSILNPALPPGPSASFPTSQPMEKSVSPSPLAFHRPGLDPALLPPNDNNRPPSSPSPRTVGLPDISTAKSEDESRSSGAEKDSDEPGKQHLTAIYRPESKTAWREELKAANEEVEKAKEERARKMPDQSEDDRLSTMALNTEEEEVKADDSVDKVWVSKRSLKSHLDIARAIAFAHGPGIMLATGGDDYTVKVWSVDSASIISHRYVLHTAQEIEPIITLRGHTAAITSVTISNALSIIFSASLDSTIRLWQLPLHNHDPYATYDPSVAIQTLEGHTESVWDICLLPPREISLPGKEAIEGRLVSASSDGSVKLWERSGSSPSTSNWKLEKSFSSFGDGVIPTCLAVYNLDFGKVLVGTSDGKTRLWDVDAGEEVRLFEGEGQGSNSQVNAILSHPTLPAIVTAHEDGYLRFYDAKSSSTTPTHIVLAHPAPITSLALSPSSPTCILTSSVDCTVRLWDLTKKTSIQELSGHRGRADEGVCAVASHPELPVIGSAGADGVVRLWGLA